MALNLSGFFQPGISQTDGTYRVSQTGTERALPVGEELHLSSGQVISGEITERNGEDVQIRLSTSDAVLHARIEQEMAASVGEQVTFEVKKGGDGLVMLRPLFQNMAQESTALSALSQAGIEAGEKSLQMVFSMMQEGMSVSREALQGMYKQVAFLEAGEIPAAVQMSRLQIPITNENLQQFMAYQNYEHQLSSAVMQIADEIPASVEQLFASGETGEGTALIGKLLQIFEGKIPEEANALTEAGELPAVVTEDISILPENETEVQVKESLEGNQADTAIDKGMVKEAVKQAADLPEGAQPLEDSGIEEAEGNIPKADRIQLARLAESAGAQPETINRLLSGEMDFQKLSELVRELAQQAGAPREQQAVKELFLSKAFQKIFRAQIGKQWTLTEPLQVEKQEVQRLYDRLNEQSRAITRALSEAVRGETQLGRSVSNLRENLDFMNQLNQLYQYVQLPLKLGGQQTNGELYVYTNKKNLAKKNGNVSAFLHLDMEHLGAVDVYVAMQQNKIQTNFRLADEKSLLLLEKNMDLLTSRLQEKGYDTTSSVTLLEEPKSAMEKILETDRNISVIGRQSFDVRT
jgi:flagellar hook-length control protein FliK